MNIKFLNYKKEKKSETLEFSTTRIKVPLTQNMVYILSPNALSIKLLILTYT
jgi:hypothetical protein